MLKVLSNQTQTLALTTQAANGAAVDVARAKTLSLQAIVTVSASTTKTFIDGTPQVQVIDFVADSAGSLNSKFFLLNSINTTTGASKGFYVWFNINSAGVDPAVAGRTGVAIVGATNATATTLVSAAKTALDLLTGDFAASTASTSHLTVNNLNPGAVTAAADGTAPTGFTFNTPSTPGVNSKVNPVTDQVSITAHGYTTGRVGQLTSTGTLPAGLSTSTNYFIIAVDANTIQFATTLALALVGTAVDITGYGTTPATVTFTPTDLGTATIQLNKSNDGTNWVTDGSTVSITGSGSYTLSKVDPEFLYYRIAYSLVSGAFSSSTVAIVKGHIS